MLRFRPSGFDLKSPVANRDSPAWSFVSKTASAAAIFIGCCSVIRMPLKWPTITVTSAATASVGIAARIERLNTPIPASLPRRMCQAEIAITIIEPVIAAASRVWAKA